MTIHYNVKSEQTSRKTIRAKRGQTLYISNAEIFGSYIHVVGINNNVYGTNNKIDGDGNCSYGIPSRYSRGITNGDTVMRGNNCYSFGNDCTLIGNNVRASGERVTINGVFYDIISHTKQEK